MRYSLNVRRLGALRSVTAPPLFSWVMIPFLAVLVSTMPCLAREGMPGVQSKPQDAAQAPVTGAVLLYSKYPEYTSAARTANVRGFLALKFTIGTDGIPKDIVVTHGLGFGLDEAAVAAIKDWKYRPATVGSKPAESQMSVRLFMGPEMEPQKHANEDPNATILLPEAETWSGGRSALFRAPMDQMKSFIAGNCGPRTQVSLRGNIIVCTGTRQIESPEGMESIRSSIGFQLFDKGGDTSVLATYKVCSVQSSGLCLPLTPPKAKADEMLDHILESLQKKLNAKGSR